MQAYEIVDSFGFDHLKIVERQDPEPGPGQVLVAVRAVSLNFRDMMMIRGLYNPRQPLPLIPCSDGVGEVLAVGEGVTRCAVGDRVATTFFERWIGGAPTTERIRATRGGPVQGVLADRIVVSEEGLVKVPDHLGDAEASTLPCAALTAWSALVEMGGVTAGDTVLVQGTGGVSIFALQFARLLGARVIATSSKTEKLERVREMGAWATVNYAEDPDWGKTVRKLTGGRGVDHVVEVGGAGTIAQSMRAVTVGGTVSVIGALSGGTTDFSLISVLMSRVRLQGILVGSREAFERMNRAVEAAELQPVVDTVFGWDEVHAAFDYMASGEHFGKICVAVES